MREQRRVSEHLLLREVVCHCCGTGTITPEAAFMFERIRSACTKKLGRDCPITITSGYRCPKYNQQVAHTGPCGPHTKGIALDMAVPEGLTYEEFYEICCHENPDGGIGVYPTRGFVHSDVREEPARWTE